MNRKELVKSLVAIIDELDTMLAPGNTVPFREMDAYIASKPITHLAGYLRRAGALDYQSPRRFYQRGVDLEIVRKKLLDGDLPRGLEGLFATVSDE